MTFTNFVVLSRQRVHDVRTRQGALITDATTDGIRWSSANLVSLCRTSLQEMYRSLLALKEYRDVAKDLLYQIHQCALKTDGSVTGLDEVNFTKVLKIVVSSNSLGEPKIYSWIDQDEFFAKRYDAKSVNNQTLIEDHCFTVVYDKTESKKKIKVLPFPTQEVEAEASVVVPLIDILTLESTISLPFVDLEDLALDYCEREMRRRNGETTLVKEITDSINRKLKELEDGLQVNRR
jgi:hypothetical protein